ncbi:LutB/LldF family L-lactate oxidation iron-sulfur protein [Tepidibacillus fermentans]|uniref:L-lactate dehydrogenase complex protein LldF n=1 Tax=Tepidibacillus fermentans TaxID=1281767 RepID=A0A4R3KIV2_9BACI|nr:LutB/LldF family L-lactate oxidation iron-sulfur protein [Tepidibacillus fermentans]TCS83142.1 L-lactate dehydrogenase complex protein LldF [Tepidibacillus fermentans]
MSKETHQRLVERVNKAKKDQFLKQSLQKAQARFRDGRKARADELGNLEEWKERASQIRRHTIENLDSYLEQFANNVRKLGGKIYFASTDKDAIDYIKKVVKEKDTHSIVKSKSMVSEEMHLNKALEAEGIRMVETDLGEYIIQLANETPSHIIVPAIHKNKEQVAELFSKVAGKELPTDPHELTEFARKTLRQEYFKAEVGITGCNFAIAESGSFVLVTNEGNARMSTTLPRTHIVIMGMERIVPTWEDLDVVLSLLPRHATGQKITSYVTAITGPKQPQDIDGPEELHIVVVDNGRSGILGTKYQEVLKCIRCGACLNVCPVYRHIGGHAYGSVYPGPIGAVLSPLLSDKEDHKELPFASTLCYACSEVCPVKIPLAELLIEHRKDYVDSKRSSFGERMAMKVFGMVAGSQTLYETATKAAHSLTKPVTKDGYFNRALPVLRNWTDVKDMPQPAKETFRDWWNKEGKDAGKE